MKKISTKIFLTMMICSCAAILLLGGISIFKSTDMAIKDKKETIAWMSDYYASQFSKEFSVIENQVEELSLYLQQTVDINELKSNPNYLAEYEKVLSPIVEWFVKERTNGRSGWVYFDPKWSKEPHDIYFTDEDGDRIPERQNYIPFSYYNNITTPADDKYWWYGPKEEKKGVWTNPYKWTLKDGMVIEVVSYALPVYVEGEFIGVVGSYYQFDEIYQRIKNIKVFKTGYATLFNEKMDVIVHPEFVCGTRETSDNLHTVQNGKYLALCEQLKIKQSGVVLYGENENELIAYSTMDNGWVLGIKPFRKEIFASAYRLLFLLFVTVIICLIFCAGFSYIFGRLIAKPILKVAKSAEAIGKGDFSTLVKTTTKDEIKILADSLNKMTENIKGLQSKTEQLAYYDELTGSNNLIKFKIEAKKILEANPDKLFAMLKLDVESFKMFNDLYGFAEGNKLLKAIVVVMNECIDSRYELLGRVTADEFVLLTVFEGLDLLEERRKGFENKLHLYDGSVTQRIVFSTGRCQIEQGETDVDTIFERVNLAHRLAKQNTVLKVCDYDHNVRKIALREKEIEAYQEIALQQEEFQLYLQAKHRLSDEKIIGAEGLVRWKSEKLGMLFPDSFIPLFEKNGFILKMDFYMFEKASETIRSWIDAGIEPVVISVNFSRLHLGNPNFVENLCEITNKYGVDRKWLEIELTETIIFNHGNLLAEFLEKLHKEGFTLSMDDFGTGYSSLGMLKDLSVDSVKLDRSFFINAQSTARERTVISSMIEMAKKLNIKTVAEGVEDKVHIELLRELGCDVVQGYYYARPIPKEEFTKNIIG